MRTLEMQNNREKMCFQLVINYRPSSSTINCENPGKFNFENDGTTVQLCVLSVAKRQNTF